jgi:hypothetical protein
MNDKLTKDELVVVSKVGDFYVSKDQAEKIMRVKSQDPYGHIRLEYNLISCNSIDAILTPSQYEIYNLKKRGGFQCKYKFWHERNQICAHYKIKELK